MKHSVLKQYEKDIQEDIVFRYATEKDGLQSKENGFIFSDPYYRFIRTIELIKKSELHIEKNETWVDLGCHYGEFLNLVAESVNCNLVGIDDWNLKAALPATEFNYFASNLAEKEWPVQLVGQNVRVVSATEVIEHMIDTDQFLRSIASTFLNGQNYLVLTTPNINSLRNRVLVPFGVYPASMEYRNIIHHVRLFNVSAIHELLKSNGYEVLHCIGVSFFPERFLKINFLRIISEKLANIFPAFCGNIIVIAKYKKD